LLTTMIPTKTTTQPPSAAAHDRGRRSPSRVRLAPAIAITTASSSAYVVSPETAVPY
jgi:hypothetical protein